MGRYESLVARATEIRNASLVGENTAERVGGLLRDILDYINDAIREPDEKYLSRLYDDSAEGLIRILDGIQFGEMFVPGLTGRGGRIGADARGELESLTLRSWLEVPEFRRNRVSIYIGIRLDTFGGGIIETVMPNADGTGSGTLKLEDGEYGAIEVGDLCMGIWHDDRLYREEREGLDDFHDYYTIYANAAETTDNKRGLFTFAGFKTVYFEITGVSGANHDSFTYLLRSELDGGNGIHPFAGMHFAGRGSTRDESRRAFSYSTTKYSVALMGVSTWEFQPSNFYEISGYLEGFSMPALDRNGQQYLKAFHGYGHVMGNAYIFGQIDTFERQVFKMSIDQSRNGSLAPGETETVTCTIMNGYNEDVTANFTLFSVTRNTGDNASDALWNAQHTNVGNPFQISFSDLGIDGINKVMAVFNVVATDEATDDTANNSIDYFS